MKNSKSKIFVALVIILLCIKCKQYYEPAISKTNLNYLVVDGFLNAGSDSTIITLSRTANLFDTITRKPETEAIVAVESEDAETFVLEEHTGGIYSIDHLTLNSAKKYRLKIHTSNGSEYLSDFVPVKITPVIDSLTWRTDSLGLSIYLNARDGQNNTRYYRWEYEETWRYHSNFDSQFDWINGQLVDRPSNNRIYFCWRSAVSSTILLGSTVKLEKDIVSNTRITGIQRGSEKVGNQYSILVKQYAITKEAFEYLQNLKKNTEQTGSIFDQQPTEFISNIHSVTNPAQPVIGFIAASTVETKRIFIINDNYQIPDWKYELYYARYECPIKRFTTQEMNTNFAGPELQHSYVAIGTPPLSPPGIYLVAMSICSDCRAHGGTNVKPSFWP